MSDAMEQCGASSPNYRERWCTVSAFLFKMLPGCRMSKKEEKKSGPLTPDHSCCCDGLDGYVAGVATFGRFAHDVVFNPALAGLAATGKKQIKNGSVVELMFDF
jgi:hypothetical protein